MIMVVVTDKDVGDDGEHTANKQHPPASPPALDLVNSQLGAAGIEGNLQNEKKIVKSEIVKYCRLC